MEKPEVGGAACHSEKLGGMGKPGGGTDTSSKGQSIEHKLRPPKAGLRSEICFSTNISGQGWSPRLHRDMETLTESKPL